MWGGGADVLNEVEFEFRALSFSVIVYTCTLYMSLKKICPDPIQKTIDIKSKTY